MSDIPSLEATFLHSVGRQGSGRLDNAAALTPLDDEKSYAVADVNHQRLAVFSTDGELLRSLGEKHLTCPWHMSAVSDGRFYVTDGIRRELACYRSDDGGFVGKLRLASEYEPSCVAITSDRRVLVSESTRPVVHVLDARTGREVRSYQLDPDPAVVAERPFEEFHTAPVPVHMCCHGDGRLLVAFGSGKIHVYDDQTGQIVGTFGDFRDAACIFATPTGRLVVSDRERQTVTLLSSSGDRIQDLVTMAPTWFPHAVAMIRGNLLLVSVADSAVGCPDQVFVYSINRRDPHR